MDSPKPFFTKNEQIKSFVLGCDPTAFNKIEKQKKVGERNPKLFEVVFEIGGDPRYFAGILANLKLIDLGIEDIYVQNLITDYQQYESSKNKNWVRIAQDYITLRMEEFDGIDPSRKIPVLLTSELLYQALLNKGEKRIPAKNFYGFMAGIPVPTSVNKLQRPLIPFYRHKAYSLSVKKEYAQKIKSLLPV